MLTVKGLYFKNSFSYGYTWIYFFENHYDENNGLVVLLIKAEQRIYTSV